MTTQETINTEEHLNVTIQDIYTQLEHSINNQMITTQDHINECFRELDERLNEGKQITILQKNVLLNLQHQYAQLHNRLNDLNIYQSLYEDYKQTKR